MKAEITQLKYDFITHKWTMGIMIGGNICHTTEINSNLGESLADKSPSYTVLNKKLICIYKKR